MEIQIDVSISGYPSGGTLRLSERVTVHKADFETAAEILQGFHVALEAVKAAREVGR